MSALLDTRAVIWYLMGSDQLSKPALQFIEDAAAAGSRVYVSAISLVEVAYLVERTRIPRDAVDKLTKSLNQQNAAISVAPVDLRVAEILRTIPRDVVPDMPDRIIAATAVGLGLPIITRDRRLLTSGIRTIW